MLAEESLSDADDSAQERVRADDGATSFRWVGPGTDVRAEFGRAIQDSEFHLLFQPEVDLRTRLIVAVEALVRWQHPRVGLIEPEEFLAAVGTSELLADLERSIVTAAIARCAEWRSTASLTVRVNATAQTVERHALTDTVRRALDRYDIEPQHVCIELTESRWHGDEGGLRAGVAELKRLGLSVALDDFGAGHSTLARLRSIPVDLIKIDRQMVSGIDTDERAQTILSAVLELGRTLDIDVTAEGVETEAEHETLLALGCRAAQGNLYSRPVVESVLMRLLRQQVR